MSDPGMLDKGYGSHRPAAQRARNQEAARMLEAGELKPGELYATLIGKPISEVAAGHESNPTLASGLRTKCLECSAELEWAGAPLASQARRCLVCGQRRLQQYNQRRKEAGKQ